MFEEMTPDIMEVQMFISYKLVASLYENINIALLC